MQINGDGERCGGDEKKPNGTTEQVPRWMSLFLKTKFFEPCEEHRGLKKCEMNTYCIDCNERMCQQCISFRKSKNCILQHKHLQIRRYVYQNVVNTPDIQRFFDSSKIQQFTVNGAKVVHLNPKAKVNGKGVNGAKEGNYRACEICKRNISEPNRFCCLACKVLFRTLEQNIRVHLQEYASNTSFPPSLPSPELNAIKEEHTQQEPCAVVAHRRRNNRRKGSPKRSPFF